MEEYSAEAIKKYQEMDDFAIFDYCVFKKCPYSWNLGEPIPDYVEEWILNDLENRLKKGV